MTFVSHILRNHNFCRRAENIFVPILHKNPLYRGIILIMGDFRLKIFPGQVIITSSIILLSFVPAQAALRIILFDLRIRAQEIDHLSFIHLADFQHQQLTLSMGTFERKAMALAKKVVSIVESFEDHSMQEQIVKIMAIVEALAQ